MDKKVLQEYAKMVFRRDNHVRYHKYCDEWVSNLTPGQLEGIAIWYHFETSGSLK